MAHCNPVLQPLERMGLPYSKSSHSGIFAAYNNGSLYAYDQVIKLGAVGFIRNHNFMV